jgi:hypothetical protein
MNLYSEEESDAFGMRGVFKKGEAVAKAWDCIESGLLEMFVPVKSESKDLIWGKLTRAAESAS